MSDLDNDELQALEYLQCLFPNRWKRMIRDAWQTGDCSKLRLTEQQESLVQMLRVTKGVTWLVNLKLGGK